MASGKTIIKFREGDKKLQDEMMTKGKCESMDMIGKKDGKKGEKKVKKDGVKGERKLAIT